MKFFDIISPIYPDVSKIFIKNLLIKSLKNNNRKNNNNSRYI